MRITVPIAEHDMDGLSASERKAYTVGRLADAGIPAYLDTFGDLSLKSGDISAQGSGTVTWVWEGGTT